MKHRNNFTHKMNYLEGIIESIRVPTSDEQEKLYSMAHKSNCAYGSGLLAFHRENERNIVKAERVDGYINIFKDTNLCDYQLFFSLGEYVWVS